MKLNKPLSNPSKRRISKRSWTKTLVAVSLITTALAAALVAQQLSQNLPSTKFRIGEKVTYDVSIGQYSKAGFAELQVVSRGKIDGRDVVELAGRFKTLGLFSTQLLVDESVSSFVDAASGDPVFARHSNLAMGFPVETRMDLKAQPGTYDLVSLLFRLRYSGFQNSVLVSRGGTSHTLNITEAGIETVNVSAGEFETTVYKLSSVYFDELGLSDIRINLDNTGDRVPVLVRAKYQNDELRIAASSIQLNRPDPVVSPTPVAIETPVSTPLPTPSPDRYINDRPLSQDLPFQLGEQLEYSISSGNQLVGTLVLHVPERRQFEGMDSLKLTATVTSVAGSIEGFATNDRMTAQVDPETLLPRRFESRFTGGLAAFSQLAIFNPDLGKVSFGNANAVDVPVGTHSILSLFYAMRSFRLTPGRDPNDPVNDTRVAVFWVNRPYVFVIRPTGVEITNDEGSKIDTTQASITTGDPLLDQLQPKIWMERTGARLPVRFQLGRLQFNLKRASIRLSGQ